MKRGMMIFFFVIILSVMVSGVGISPDMVHLKFEPLAKGEISIRVLNTDDVAGHFSVGLTGDIAKYFEVDEDAKYIKAKGLEEFLISYEFPYKIGTPGNNIVIIDVRKVNPGGGGIAALVSVVSMIIVDVPYPGKYLDYKVACSNVNLGDNINVILDLENKGKDDIFNVKSYFDFSSYSDNEINYLFDKHIESFSLPVGKGERKTLIFNSSKLGPGGFYMDSYIIYDGIKSINKSLYFNIGHEHIEILDYTKEIKVGDIRKFVVELESQWNSPIDNVYIDLHLERDGVAETESALSQSEHFEPWEKKKIPIFIDASNLNTGHYNAVINVNYGDKKTESVVDVNITSGFSGTSYLIVFVVILLILADVLWINSIRKKNGKDPDKKVKDKINKLENKFFGRNVK